MGSFLEYTDNVHVYINVTLHSYTDNFHSVGVDRTNSICQVSYNACSSMKTWQLTWPWQTTRTLSHVRSCLVIWKGLSTVWLKVNQWFPVSTLKFICSVMDNKDVRTHCTMIVLFLLRNFFRLSTPLSEEFQVPGLLHCKCNNPGKFWALFRGYACDRKREQRRYRHVPGLPHKRNPYARWRSGTCYCITYDPRLLHMQVRLCMKYAVWSMCFRNNVTVILGDNVLRW